MPLAPPVTTAFLLSRFMDRLVVAKIVQRSILVPVVALVVVPVAALWQLAASGPGMRRGVGRQRTLSGRVCRPLRPRLSRYPGMRTIGLARSLRSNFIHGPAGLPVTLEG